MADTKKKDNRKRQAGPLQKRARRDVRLSIDPILDEIKRQQDQAQRELEQNTGRLGDIYGGLAKDIAPLGAQFDTQAQGISGDLNQALGGLTSLLQPSMEAYQGLDAGDAQGAQSLAPTQGGQAATGYFGALGAGGQELLSNDRMRNAAYQTSVKREIPLQQAAYEKRFLQDYRDTVSDLMSSRQDLINSTPQQILARLDQLRDQRKQNRLANAELELRKEIADKQAHQNKRAFNAGQDVLQGQQNRAHLGAQIKNLKKDVLPGLTARIQQTTEGLPKSYGDTYKQGGKWGYQNYQSGDFVPLPELSSLYRQRYKKRQRLQTLKKRKRKA